MLWLTAVVWLPATAVLWLTAVVWLPATTVPKLTAVVPWPATTVLVANENDVELNDYADAVDEN